MINVKLRYEVETRKREAKTGKQETLGTLKAEDSILNRKKIKKPN